MQIKKDTSLHQCPHDCLHLPTGPRNLRSLTRVYGNELPWIKIGIASKKAIDLEQVDPTHVPEGALSNKETIGDDIHEFETVETIPQAGCGWLVCCICLVQSFKLKAIG